MAAQICALSAPIFDYSNKFSLVNALNVVAGVRMEERSPGSYRINIRGSSLRSPFGVRNVKVYWNGIPVTDPGGNTYFNQFATNNFSTIEIAKGPASSMYGAGTGGLIMLEGNAGPIRPVLNLEYNTGSYNQQNIFIRGRTATGKSNSELTFAHNSSGGYRDHSTLRRDNVSYITSVKYDIYELGVALLFTNMYYQTPGALTLNEFNKDPRAARPATSTFPSAAAAKAAIYQTNLLAGIKQKFWIMRGLTNNTVVYGSFAQIKNPAIRNYERRTEPSLGGRSVFTYTKRWTGVKLTIHSGAEWQQGLFTTRVYSNKNGNPDTLQTDDDTRYQPLVVFLQATAEIHDKWYLMSGFSINETQLRITRNHTNPISIQNRQYRSEFAPRLSLARWFGNRFKVSATVSKGFSPPTLAEVLPSTGVINTELEAEKGWNIESSVHFYRSKYPLLTIELTGFYFRLNDALVTRRDISGADFFVNAGDIRQKGIELHTELSQRFYGSFIKDISLRSDISVNHFRYGTFVKGADDFSGNKVPSVPASSLSLLSETGLLSGFYLRMSYYAAAPVYLNDANSAKAPAYHLLGCQIGWKNKARKNYKFSLYTGADNILNEIYSAGNDINAAGGRYYNAAARRNFYAGASVQWTKYRKL